jgi:hypothetical protein
MQGTVRRGFSQHGHVAGVIYLCICLAAGRWAVFGFCVWSSSVVVLAVVDITTADAFADADPH